MLLSFHPLIQDAYSKVHDWLRDRDDTDGYMEIASPPLDCSSMKHIAAQFSVYFPAHYFKCVSALEKIVQRETLLTWLKHNPHITLIDVGCGTGAASAAFISVLLDLIESGALAKPVTLFCIGVDLDKNVLGIYYQLLNHIKMENDDIQLEIRLIDKPVAELVTDLDIHLQKILRAWDQPALSNVMLIQSNIVSSLNKSYSQQQGQRSRLRESVSPEAFIEEQRFGAREARSYHQLFQQVSIDNLHIFTVGTQDQSANVQEMGESIKDVFSQHQIQPLSKGGNPYFVDFINPDRSYWKTQKDGYGSTFYIDIASIKNLELQRDRNWQDVIKIKNLRLAWVRVRAILFREVLRDEAEIRIFEHNLDHNLQRLQQELIAYAEQVARTNDRLQYLFVKKADAGRPLVLSRMDEDILSVAIIQVLGKMTSGLQSSSYAFRLNPDSPHPTEYLYEYWFETYRRFTREIKEGVGKYPGCKILRVDIKSYFTNIQQRRLVETVTSGLRTRSERITWLIKKLLLVDLDTDSHRPQHGLSQGGAGSGFYANDYLTPIDSHFGVNNAWEVKLYRFVDDIVLVIPNPDDLQEVRNELENKILSLGLELNPGKEEIYDYDEYLKRPDKDDELDKLSDRFVNLTNSLWCVNTDYRNICTQEERWWTFIDTYRNRLRSIGFFVDADRLSRKIHQYLNSRKRKGDLRGGYVKQLRFPPLHSQNWATEFRSLNSGWNQKCNELRNSLLNLLKGSYEKLSTAESQWEPRERRKLRTRIYFCANRLTRLGFQDIEGLITQILMESPEIIRQPQYVVRSLAIQEFPGHLIRLLNHYKNNPYSAGSFFVALILHSLRYLNEVPEEAMREIVKIAIDRSRPSIERLMATETWLIRINCECVAKNSKIIQDIISTEQSARLQKNYMLVLGKCDPDTVTEPANNDYILQDTHKLVRNKEVDRLFAEEEPDIIRNRFYSGEYPDDSREFNDMGYY